MSRFPGIYVAIVSPLTESYEVDYAGLRRHADWLIQNGVHGLVPTGSVGEYASLTDLERAKVVETIIETAAGRVPVVVGVAAPSTAKAFGWAKHAKEAGASGVMALPPINYRPTRNEVIAYYNTLSSAGLPIIAYNNPYDTSTDLTPDLLVELAEIENVVAVKEFSGDVRRIPEILERTELEVLAGADDICVEGLLAGATGWIAGLTNAVPRESVQLYEYVQSGDLEGAKRLYRRMLPLFRYDSTPRLVQAIKYAMQLSGNPAGPTRPPRLALEESERQAIERAYQAIAENIE